MNTWKWQRDKKKGTWKRCCIFDVRTFSTAIREAVELAVANRNNKHNILLYRCDVHNFFVFHKAAKSACVYFCV